MAYSTSNTMNVSFTDTSLSQTLSTKAKEIVLTATEDCYISFDSTTVTATNGFYITADKQYIFHILYPPFVTVMKVSSNGVLSVMELGDSVLGLGVTYTDTFTSDTNLVGEVIETFTGDADLTRVDIILEFTGDTNLVGEVSTDISGDSNLTRENITDTIVGDASLLRVIADSVTGDASLLAVIADSFSGDSHLAVIISASATGDANLLRENVTETFTGDCVILDATRVLGTFTGDANLERDDIISTFFGDANLNDTVSGLAFNGDAKLVTI